MKKIFFLLMIVTNLIMAFAAVGQHFPEWTVNMNTSPDSARLLPIKTLTDLNGNILVLSFYRKDLLPSGHIDKIYINKFGSNGNILWNLIFDNNGSGNARGFDMAIDNIGNCFVAGWIIDSLDYHPLILKFSDTGNLLWRRDSTLSFNEDRFEQIILNDSLVYIGGPAGIAVFDLNGNEQWSHPVGSEHIAVDKNGRMVLIGYPASAQTFYRYDIAGNLDFSDSTILGERIAIDWENNNYLLAQYSNYELVKFDSNGVFQWWKNSFPLNLSFGDPSFNVLTDLNNDVLVIGLADSMFKFHPDGTEAWRKSMNGLDTYLTDSKITYSNFLAIGGTTYDSLGYEVMVAFFDQNGNRNWYGMYNSNNQQEFTVSIDINGEGVYLLEDSVGTSTLIKFESPFFNTSIDYNLVCVDSVWYEPGNPILINVRIFNGNIQHMNYPSVQIVSPAGDTIGNRINFVNFFAHLGNEFQVYQDTITVAGITDFSAYTFLIREGFGDSTAIINWCNILGIENIGENSFILFPNPATTLINLSFQQPFHNGRVEIFSEVGKICISKDIHNETLSTLNVSDLSPGFYILRLMNDSTMKHFRFIKQ